MASVSASAADDVGSEVLFLGAVVLAVADLATVLTSLVFIVAQSTVQGGKFSKLVTLELVLSLGNRCSLG